MGNEPNLTDVTIFLNGGFFVGGHALIKRKLLIPNEL